MCGKLCTAVFLFIATMPVYAVAQTAEKKSAIDDVVKHCVDVVHNFPADQMDVKFFKKFDAFYNSASSQVENNSYLNGDLPPLYQFKKCMAMQGFPLK